MATPAQRVPHRQLEAITRIAESLAKLSLSPVATESHVEEAFRLFEVSTMKAVVMGHACKSSFNPMTHTTISGGRTC